MDTIDFSIYFPVLIVLFAAIGWILATGYEKSQYIRLLDILIYGPYLIYLCLKNTYTFSVGEKVFLLLLGSTTVSYNLRNFIGGL